MYNNLICYEIEFAFMGRTFASDLREHRRKVKDLQAGAQYLQKVRNKAPELLSTFGIEGSTICKAEEEFKEKAEALSMAIKLEEVSVFTYIKKGHLYWKCEWRAPNGRMRQVHLGPAQGKRPLSEAEALQKARNMKAEDLGR